MSTREVSPQETASLVLRYLQTSFPASSRQFQLEAEGLLRLVQPPSAQQQVKGLHAILNEYVELEARARQRAAFERAFGDDAPVRGLLSKLGTVLDDYMAAAHARASAASAGLGGGGGGTSGAARPMAAAAAAERPAGRKRKSAQPRRLVEGVAGTLSSRQLFGGGGEVPSSPHAHLHCADGPDGWGGHGEAGSSLAPHVCASLAQNMRAQGLAPALVIVTFLVFLWVETRRVTGSRGGGQDTETR